MMYRQFTDLLMEKLGDMNWGQIGRMSKVYKLDFILKVADDCLDIRTYRPMAKTTYLHALCRKLAGDEDLVKKHDIIDDSQF